MASKKKATRARQAPAGGSRGTANAPAPKIGVASRRTGGTKLFVIGAVIALFLAGVWLWSAHSAASTDRAVVVGTVQRLSVAVDFPNGYSPEKVYAKADVPVEIAFGKGEGCMTSVQFPQLGIVQDLSKGAAVVKLPGLKPGTYGFVCATNHRTGELIVQ